MQWTGGLTVAAPRAVSFETAGPGDDLSLELTDGSTVEIQAKKGLRADWRFWSAIDALCEGIREGRCDYGILIVCPNSSRPVKEGYGRALERIGDGRFDDPSTEQTKLARRLEERGYDGESICARMRIRVVSALESAGDAIAAAELGHICSDPRQLISAWNALGQDALRTIASRGRRKASSLSGCLRASAIDVQDVVKNSPAAILHRLLQWTMSRTEQFEILGVSEPMPTDGAWLPLQALVRDATAETASTAEEALADYRALGEKSHVEGDVVDARTIGTFRKLCVVVGGPGSGKSLLLKVLAREFAEDSYVSLRVRLRDLVKRMERGCGVEEDLLQLGLDATGVGQEQLGAASLPDLVLLCDGLDECGGRQADVASGFRDIAASHPSYRIVVTTRPIGYSTSELRDWRHYEIAPLPEGDTAKCLEALCRSALAPDAEGRDGLELRIRKYLKERSVLRVLARSPLLLAFGAAVFLRWRDPGVTKGELYERVFRLLEEESGDRERMAELPAKAIRRRVLNQLGWLLGVAACAGRRA